MSKIDELVQARPDAIQIGKPCSQDLVNAAQQSLALAFPKSLQDFLMTRGWVCIGSWEVYGLQSNIDDIEQQELVRESRRYFAKTGQRAVVVSSDGGEYVFVLSASNENVVEDVVRACDSHHGEEDDGWPTGLTFLEFIESLCDKASTSTEES